MVRGKSRADLDTDRKLNLSLVRLMEVIGEAAVRMPEDYRSRHPEVPWGAVIGMRNRMIHGYDVIDFDILWTVVRQDLPPLVDALARILSEEGQI